MEKNKNKRIKDQKNPKWTTGQPMTDADKKILGGMQDALTDAANGKPNDGSKPTK